MIEEDLLRYIPDYAKSSVRDLQRINDKYYIALRDGRYFDKNKSSSITVSSIKELRGVMTRYSLAFIYAGLWGNYAIDDPERRDVLDRVSEMANKYGEAYVEFEAIGKTKAEMCCWTMLSELEKRGHTGYIGRGEILTVERGNKNG